MKPIGSKPIGSKPFGSKPIESKPIVFTKNRLFTPSLKKLITTKSISLKTYRSSKPIALHNVSMDVIIY
jgi:hypothetical protein